MAKMTSITSVSDLNSATAGLEGTDLSCLLMLSDFEYIYIIVKITKISAGRYSFWAVSDERNRWDPPMIIDSYQFSFSDSYSLLGWILISDED